MKDKVLKRIKSIRIKAILFIGNTILRLLAPFIGVKTISFYIIDDKEEITAD